MYAVAYQNTEAGIRKLAVRPNPEKSPAILAMERRKAELAAELSAMVREREEQATRLAAIRKETARALNAAAKARVLFDASVRSPIRLDAIMRRICRVFGISRARLVSDTRNARIVLARHAVCYWAARRTTMSLPQIGRRLGNRDHTSIIHAQRSYVQKRAKMGRTLREVR